MTSTPESYQNRIAAELEMYSATANVHDAPPIMQYWSSKFLVPLFQLFGFSNSNEMFRTYIARACRAHPGEVCRVLSIGAGDAATEKGFSGRFQFATFDINSWKPAEEYHVILAIQCLHHFVELEVLFDKIHRALQQDGFFLTDDMIGRNGHQRWPEALHFVDEFWKELPDSYRFNHQLQRVEERYENWDCSKQGFEGIRSQDILPLLIQRFHFDLFVAFGYVVDIFIDCVHAVDVREIESGRLKPTHIYAAMMKHPSDSPKFYKHLTPEFSVRSPNK